MAGIFLFVYTFIDSTPHGMYGDDQAKKVHRLLILLELQMAEACFFVELMPIKTALKLYQVLRIGQVIGKVVIEYEIRGN